MSTPEARATRGGPAGADTTWFEAFFEEQFPKLHRYLWRLAGDAELASELAQEAFMRLYSRRSPPEDAKAWLFTVGINLMRNAKSKESRRLRLLTAQRSTHVLSDPPAPPGATICSAAERARVREALDALRARDRELLLLRAEGHSYRELASILSLHEASVGTQLKRAKQAFRVAYGGTTDAS